MASKRRATHNRSDVPRFTEEDLELLQSRPRGRGRPMRAYEVGDKIPWGLRAENIDRRRANVREWFQRKRAKGGSVNASTQT